MVPRRRLGTAEDIGGTVIYLASRAAAFVTGAVIPLEGGMAL
jgi:NAD(P)-dependent dehydrogenase (short-subunit alcohol dehydrogenase family)